MEIRRSLPPSLPRKILPHALRSSLFLLWPRPAAMKMRDRGEYERKNPSPLIQQQFLSQSNFADCPVDREEVLFLCLFNQVGTESEEGSSSFFALTPAIRILPFICPFIFGSIPKSQFDTFGDFIFTVICEQWQAQWTDDACFLSSIYYDERRRKRRSTFFSRV